MSSLQAYMLPSLLCKETWRMRDMLKVLPMVVSRVFIVGWLVATPVFLVIFFQKHAFYPLFSSFF